jgi:ketosteroid isomerase-like protein
MTSAQTLVDLDARFVRTLDQLNCGKLDEMLTRYAENVTVLIAAPRSGDPVQETMFHGKAGFLDCLFRYAATLSPMTLLRLLVEGPSRAVATIACRGGRTMTYEVDFDKMGLGSRVRISLA